MTTTLASLLATIEGELAQQAAAWVSLGDMWSVVEPGGDGEGQQPALAKSKIEGHYYDRVHGLARAMLEPLGFSVTSKSNTGRPGFEVARLTKP